MLGNGVLDSLAHGRETGPKSRLCIWTTIRSIAQAPFYRHTERLIRGRSGGVARLLRRQRHLG